MPGTPSAASAAPTVYEAALADPDLPCSPGDLVTVDHSTGQLHVVHTAPLQHENLARALERGTLTPLALRVALHPTPAPPPPGRRPGVVLLFRRPPAPPPEPG